MKKQFLILCTCAAILLGFSLPWLVTARQDRSAQGETLYFDTPTALLSKEPDLFPRLELAAGASTIVDLTLPMSRHTGEEALDLAADAMNVLSGQGFPVFSPDRWISQSATCCLMGQEGVPVPLEGFSSSSVSAYTDLSALVWECRFTTEEGEELTCLVDDDLGYVLAFSYQCSAEEISQTESAVLDQEIAATMANFCQEYYHVEVSSPTVNKDGSWSILLQDHAGERYALSLSANSTTLVFNLPPS